MIIVILSGEKRVLQYYYFFRPLLVPEPQPKPPGIPGQEEVLVHPVLHASTDWDC